MPKGVSSQAYETWNLLIFSVCGIKLGALHTGMDYSATEPYSNQTSSSFEV